MEKYYKGNHDVLGSEWVKLTPQPVKISDVGWLVFSRKMKEACWLDVKVCAEDVAPQKANYFLKWDGNRFLETRDRKLLYLKRGVLYETVKKLLPTGEAFASVPTYETPGRKLRVRSPRVPASGHNLVGVIDTEECGWAVYAKDGDTDPWLNFKVVASMPVLNKANYGVAWNGSRLARNKEWAILYEHRRELHDRLLMFLELNY